MESAKRHGIPCYLIAQGGALKSKRLLQTLEQMAADTGGDSFRVNKIKDIAEVFTTISRDLKNTYLLAFRATAADRKWYPLAVSIRDRKDLKVRCREGYYLD
jgi:VWFA-related protein